MLPDHRLDDHRRDLSAVLRERLLQRRDRIEGQREGRRGERLRDSGRIRDPQRRHARTGLHQQRIDVPVIAAFELDGQVPARESARHPQRAHRRFGARVHQPHHLHRRHRAADHLGQFDFALGGRAEAGADLQHLARSLQCTGKAVAQNQRPPGAHVVDVLVAVDVEDARALAARDEARRSADAAKRADRRIHAARE